MNEATWFPMLTTATMPDLRALAGFDTLEQATAVVAGLAVVQSTAPRRTRPTPERSAA